MRYLMATRQEFARARRLHRRGIPVDQFELERMRKPCLVSKFSLTSITQHRLQLALGRSRVSAKRRTVK